MAERRFLGKAIFVPETEYNEDETQMNSPSPSKRPNLEDRTTDYYGYDSQNIFTELPDDRLTKIIRDDQEWLSHSEEMAETKINFEKTKEIGIMTFEYTNTIRHQDNSTMTDLGVTCANNTDMEIRCNEFFGSVVACELANYHGNARFDIMKEIIDIFKKSNSN